MAWHIVIICGYEPFLIDEIPDEIKKYLAEVAAFCNEHHSPILIFSGGFTRGRTLPFLSEAEAMIAYTKPLLNYSPTWIQREEDSHTTLENIKNCAAYLADHSFFKANTPVTIFCNSSKAFAVKCLSRHFLKRKATIKAVDWQLKNSWLMQSLVNIYTLPAMHIPFLARIHRNVRKKQFAKL